MVDARQRMGEVLPLRRARRHFGIGAWAIAVMMTPLFVPAKVAPEEARATLAKAQATSEIRKEGGQAFHLRAEVRVVNPGGEVEEGLYEEFWVTPRRWRREIRFPSYWGIEIANGAQIARKRTVPIVPGRIEWVARMLVYPGAWVKEEAKATKASECARAPGGALCLKLEGENGRTTMFRIDPATGVVLGTEGGISRREYSGFAPFCEALVPNLLKSYKERQLVASAEVKERSELPMVADSLFEFPKDSEVWPWCPDTEPPKVESTAKPQYPAAAAMGGKQGRVVVGVILDEAGKVKAVGVKESAGKDFDAAALEAVRRWTFSPAHCGATAVPSDHIVTINFTMH